jgi:NAD(P)-dependent dehydrogenase (short-subunit alcohol dehydrogenase family)
MRAHVVEASEADSARARVAIVTGAGRGIGAKVAAALAARGCDLMLTARTEPEIAGVAQEARCGGRRVAHLAIDLTAPDAVDALMESTLDAFGRLDIVVGCAGMLAASPYLETSDESLQRTINVNLLAPMRLSREAARAMCSRGGGRIIHVASMFAFVSSRQHVAYTACKAGLVGLTKALAVEFAGHGVQVNAIAPGHVRTPMIAQALALPDGERQLARHTPMRRIAEPEEVANVAAYLALDAPSFLTGEVVVLDGGYTCR